MDLKWKLVTGFNWFELKVTGINWCELDLTVSLKKVSNWLQYTFNWYQLVNNGPVEDPLWPIWNQLEPGRSSTGVNWNFLLGIDMNNTMRADRMKICPPWGFFDQNNTRISVLTGCFYSTKEKSEN